MAEETIFKVVNGQIYGWNSGDGMSGMGEGKWDWIAPVATGVGGAVTAWLAAKTLAKQPYGVQPYGQQGAQFGATPGGVFGNIDSTTLLLIGGAALLFFSMPSGKR